MRHMSYIPTVTPSVYNHVGRAIAGFTLTTLFVVGAATAQVAAGTTGIDATGNAQSERAACLSGRTQQDRTTCLTEVKNANAARRAGKVDNAGGQFEANALQRCAPLKGDDKTACEARVAGRGKIQGSVAGGGVLTEIETEVTSMMDSTPMTPKTDSGTIMVPPAK